MATWTQADIDRIKGWMSAGIKSVRYEGPPGKSIEYQDLDQARKLLAEMVADVNSASRQPYTLIASRKGT